jgi:hypothetical protein
VLRLASIAAFGVLVAPSVALADYGLTVRKTQVQPGERMTIWGNTCFHNPRFHLGMRIYLVAARHLPATIAYRRRPPVGPPYHFLGRLRCTHTARPQPWGDGGYWTGTLAVRVPSVPRGRYRLVFYCAPCHKGPGGNVVDTTFYFDGRRRQGLDALVVSHG